MTHKPRPYVVDPRDPTSVPQTAEYLCCEACQLFLARWVLRAGVPWRCDACGGQLIPRAFRPRRPPPPDPVRDLAVLAEWSPFLEGRGQDYEKYLGNLSNVETEARERNRAGRLALRAAAEGGAPPPSPRGYLLPIERIEPLADHMHVRAAQDGPAPNGRPDSVDGRSPELDEALVALRRLDALVRTEDGARAALVLLYAYWLLGPTARTFWDAATDAELVDRDRYARRSERYQETHPYTRRDDGEVLGLGWRVGIVFVDPSLRATWLCQGSLGRAFARQYTGRPCSATPKPPGELSPPRRGASPGGCPWGASATP
jgi:hypothetical protein